MIEYFSQQPRDYFELLQRLYPRISLVSEGGVLTPIPDYSFLANRIEKGKGWEDLFCLPALPR
jgi:hypothetical protein